MKQSVSKLFALLALGSTFSIQAFDLKKTFTDAKNKVTAAKQTTTAKVIAIKEHASLSLMKKETAAKYSKGNYPYAKEVATVRNSVELAPQEKDFLAKRLKVVQQNLSKLLDGVVIPDNAVPRIAIAGSGGGYRAMVSTNGSLAGAESWGLLGITTYLAGVSGSTWAISGFINSKLSAAKYVEQLASRINKPLNSDFNNEYLQEAILRKTVFNQPNGFIDMYGNLVAQKIIAGLDGKKNPNDFFLYDCSPEVTTGNAPMPLYTGVIVQNGQYTGWVEYTPFEIGSRDLLKSFIPTWAFGRAFNEGKSIDNPTPQALSFGMGIWGSAMTADVKETLENARKKQSPAVQKIIDSFLGSSSTKGIQKIRVIEPAKVYNWNLGIKGAPLTKEKTTSIADAGLWINIPTPPFLYQDQRPCDIIIVIDNGQTLGNASQLKHTEEYAKKYKVKFPPIDYKKGGDIISVHMDEKDPTCPIVIYLPMVTNPNYEKGWNPSPLIKVNGKDPYTATSNFAYTPEQVKQLSGLTALNISQDSSKKAILDAISFRINQKAPGTIKPKEVPVVAAAPTPAPEVKQVSSDENSDDGGISDDESDAVAVK